MKSGNQHTVNTLDLDASRLPDWLCL